jgi:hypothetical protein
MANPTVPVGIIRLTFTRPEAQALLEAGELAQDVRETRGLPVPTPLRAAIVRLSAVLGGER